MCSTPLKSDLQSHTSSTQSEGEVLVKIEGVSKIFCRDLKKSLLYGLRDSVKDLLSWGKKTEVRGQGSGPSALRTTASEYRPLRPGEFLAVDRVSFGLRRGECLGLIGHNGAGKTTLLKMLSGLIKLDYGRIEMRGRVSAMIALGAGFNPILTGRENIYVAGALRGLSKQDIAAKMDGIIDFAEVAEFIDMPVQGYSSGMQVRLGFAVASALSPDVLLIDEVLAVGDMDFRMKCLGRIYELLDAGTAVILVSHSMVDIQRICSRIIVMDHGKIAFAGDVSAGIARYESLGILNRSKHDAAGSPPGRVTLSDLSLQAGDGASPGITIQVQTGDHIRLRFRMHVLDAIEDARVRVFLDSARAGLLSSLTSAVATDMTRLETGVHVVEIDFLEFPLLVGAYSLGISVHGNGTTVFYSGNQEGLIEVVGPEVKALARGNAGLLALPARWRLEPA